MRLLILDRDRVTMLCVTAMALAASLLGGAGYWRLKTAGEKHSRWPAIVQLGLALLTLVLGAAVFYLWMVGADLGLE